MDNRLAENNNLKLIFPKKEVPDLRTKYLNKELSVDDICRIYFASPHTVRNMLTGRSYAYVGGPVAKRLQIGRPRKITDELIYKILKMKKTNKVVDIAKITGLHVSTVSKIINNKLVRVER